jgi:hypothetical protein
MKADVGFVRLSDIDYILAVAPFAGFGAQARW